MTKQTNDLVRRARRAGQGALAIARLLAEIRYLLRLGGIGRDFGDGPGGVNHGLV